MDIVFTLLVAIFVSWFLLKPFARKESLDESLVEPNLSSLLMQKSRCYQMLQELETDYAEGKLMESDYTDTRNQLLSEESNLLTKIDHLSHRAI